MRRFLLVLIVLLCATGTVAAQSATAVDENAETIKALLERMARLEKRIAELEAKQPAAGAPAPAAEPVAPVAAAEKPAPGGMNHPGMGQSGAPPQEATFPSLKISGFADVGFRANNLSGDHNSFALGQLDLFMTSKLSEKWSVFGELVFESGDDNVFAVDLERFLLRYAPNDYLHVGFGRYHTAIGFYNESFHHGSWLQTATERPFIFAFEDEGGILPIHNVGLTATGHIPSGSLGLNYIFEISNGRSSSSPLSEPVQNISDENSGKAVNVGLYARPSWAPGLRTGFSYYRDRLTPSGLPNIDESIFSGHLVYQGSRLEILSEGLVIRHALLNTGRAFNTGSFYTLVSHRFGSYRPYFRYQFLDAPSADPLLGATGRRHGPSIGLRYDFNESGAFKLQYNHTRRGGLSSLHEITMQFAFTF